MPETTIVRTDAPADSAPQASPAASEAAAGAVEASAAAAIEVAKIEADRDVTIAQMQKDTADDAIEATNDHSEEYERWRTEIGTLQETIRKQGEALDSIQARLSAQPQSRPSPREPNTSESTGSSQGNASPAQGANPPVLSLESPEPEPVKPKATPRHHRWI